MANNKSIIREIDLKNIQLNLNTNKSTVTDFIGCNKNTGAWYNNCLSPLYYTNDTKSDSVISLGSNSYKFIGKVVYKNGTKLIDYSNIPLVKTETLDELDDEVIAYAPGIKVSRDGLKIKVNDIEIAEYSTNSAPYIIVDNDDWCVLYSSKAITKNMTKVAQLSTAATAAMRVNGQWVYPVSDDSSITLCSIADNSVVKTYALSPALIKGNVGITGWNYEYEFRNMDSKRIFASYVSIGSSEPFASINNYSSNVFQYYKGIIIEDGFLGPTFTEIYSENGESIDYSIKPDDYYLYSQPYSLYIKLGGVSTKFMRYSSFIVAPWATICLSPTDNSASAGANRKYSSSLDGVATLLIESINNSNSKYTNNSKNYMQLSNNTVYCGSSYNETPLAIGLFNRKLTPEYLDASYGNFKLIYNNDALAGISYNNSIIAPWNDIDENSLTIVDDDIYYYSLSNNSWVHISVSVGNELIAKKVGENILVNATVNNCVNNDEIYTFSADLSPASYYFEKPRMGFINTYYSGYLFDPFKSVHDEYKGAKDIVGKMFSNIINTSSRWYLSIGRGSSLLNEDIVGPIYGAITLIDYNKRTTVRYDIWQYFPKSQSNGTPNYGINTINYEYTLQKINTIMSSEAYASDEGTVLKYNNSWSNEQYFIDNKLRETEKSMTDTTWYNLSPNLDIMTYIDGFNTVSLLKIGNATRQLIVYMSKLLLVYNILSESANVSDYFVLQGQQYAVMNNYINKVDLTNGEITAQTPIVSVEGLNFLGNTDKQAYFFSKMKKCIMCFMADNTLEVLANATELNNNTTSVFSKQTNDIFLLLDNKTVIMTNSFGMFEVDDKANFISIGDDTWTDGNNTYSYYKTDNTLERKQIELETQWYGDTANRKMLNVDCIYIELWDEDCTPGTFSVSFDSLVNNSVSTKTSKYTINSRDYDSMTNTVYLRYQPAVQAAAAFKLNINTNLAIKRLAVGYTSDGTNVLTKALNF